MHEALRQARKDAHLTQVYVAEQMGVTQGAVHCWESGRAKPQSDKLLALAKLYGCSVDRLVGNDHLLDAPTDQTA